MKVIVTRLVNGQFGGKGRVDFFLGDERIHSEDFTGRITGDRYVREVDVPEDARAVCVVVDGEFIAHIED